MYPQMGVYGPLKNEYSGSDRGSTEAQEARPGSTALFLLKFLRQSTTHGNYKKYKDRLIQTFFCLVQRSTRLAGVSELFMRLMSS